MPNEENKKYVQQELTTNQPKLLPIQRNPSWWVSQEFHATNLFLVMALNLVNPHTQHKQHKARQKTYRNSLPILYYCSQNTRDLGLQTQYSAYAETLCQIHVITGYLQATNDCYYFALVLQAQSILYHLYHLSWHFLHASSFPSSVTRCPMPFCLLQVLPSGHAPLHAQLHVTDGQETTSPFSYQSP